MKGSAAAAAAGGEDDVELLKAVAQAWHAQSGNPRASASAAQGGGDDGDGGGGGGGVSSSGARRAGWGGPRRGPSRFKLEAAATAAARGDKRGGGERAWDFAQSLWDTYELVAVARKLESGLVLADHHPGAAQERAATTREGGGGVKRARESSRSLRSMFLRSSSRRFGEPSS